MKRFEHFLIIVLVVLFLDSVVVLAYEPAVQWQKTFGGSGNDGGLSVQQTTDGGFIITGYKYPLEEGEEDVYLIKVDPNGDLLWENNFGYYSARGNCVQQTTDGGYIITGDAGYTILKKTDPNGNSQWSNGFFYDPHGFSGGTSVEQTTDGGYIITGYKGYFESYSPCNAFLIKTDPNGDSEWDKIFGSYFYSWCESVHQTTDGGYIVAGVNESDVYLVKTDPDGNSEWEKTFGGSNTDEDYSVQQTTDGGYIVAGYTTLTPPQRKDVYLIKTDPNGDSQWEKTFGGTVYDEGHSVQQTADGGYIVAGYTSSFGAGNDDVYLIKTDSAGNLVWQKTLGGSNDDKGYSIQQTSDGGYIIAGETESYGAGGSDVYLIKLSSEVCQYVLLGDLNDDCKVDFYDFAIMALNWLIDFNFSDLDIMVEKWLIDCNIDPTNPACIPK